MNEPANVAAPIVIFIGSGEASLVERKVLIHTLRQRASRPLDIHVVNGTHNAVEQGNRIYPLPLPLQLKYRNGDTEFGLCRYLIPRLRGYAGRAIYLDSDMICLADIAELAEQPPPGTDSLAMPTEDRAVGEPRLTTAVMPMDCATTRFDLERIFAEIDRGLYMQRDLMHLTRRFLERHPYRIGILDPAWNVLDRPVPGAKLVHYTNMYTQPWKRPGHPFGGLWFEHFREALAAGAVSERDVEISLRRCYVRPDIRTATA